MKKLIIIIVVIFALTFIIQNGITEEKKSSEKSKEMADALAVFADMNPAIVMDVPSSLFGDYHCLHFTRGLTNMVHIAKDPAKYTTDLIMLVHAEPLIQKGLKANEFPQLTTPPYGPDLTPGQWYYIPSKKLLILPVDIENAGVSGNLLPKAN